VFRVRRELTGAAERVGLAVAAAGTHPFSDWKDQVLSPGVRDDSAPPFWMGRDTGLADAPGAADGGV
jgi:gamma-glutamyl:cysteine ligase YbdK (ATP-grasp superfamily)